MCILNYFSGRYYQLPFTTTAEAESEMSPLGSRYDPPGRGEGDSEFDNESRFPSYTCEGKSTVIMVASVTILCALLSKCPEQILLD